MTRLDRLRVRIAERAASRMFDQVTTGPMNTPGRGVAWWASLVLATVVHLFTIALVVLSVWLLLIAGSVIAIVFSIALFGLAFLMRPRLGRLPKDTTVVDPAAAPRLYALVGRVTDRLGSRPVWRIVLTADVNAAFGAVGLRQRNVLILGLPLWNLLDPRERIALLGHEVGHGVNGDLRRGLYVGSSVGTLRLAGPCMRDLHTAIVRRDPDVWASSRAWLANPH